MKISGSLCHQYPFRLNQTFRLFYNGNSDITLGVPNTTSKWDLVVPAKRHGLRTWMLQIFAGVGVLNIPITTKQINYFTVPTDILSFHPSLVSSSES